MTVFERARYRGGRSGRAWCLCLFGLGGLPPGEPERQWRRRRDVLHRRLGPCGGLGQGRSAPCPTCLFADATAACCLRYLVLLSTSLSPLRVSNLYMNRHPVKMKIVTRGGVPQPPSQLRCPSSSSGAGQSRKLLRSSSGSSCENNLRNKILFIIFLTLECSNAPLGAGHRSAKAKGGF
jgi:hypothetical protein